VRVLVRRDAVVLLTAVRAGVNRAVTFWSRARSASLPASDSRPRCSAASPVLADRRFLGVEVLIPTLPPEHVVAAQGVRGAFRGGGFDVLPLLLCECFCFRPGCQAAGVGGGGEQSGVGVGEGGVDVLAVPADGFARGGPVHGAGGVELASPRRGDLTELQRLVRAGTTAQRLVRRARIVLLAAQGYPNAVIAARARAGIDTVRKWRHRWWRCPRLASLGDAKRAGRPPLFTPVQVAGLKALACQPPQENGVPLARWSAPELARHAMNEEICASISSATVRRLLAEDALKPWQYQSWIFLRDPEFATKAEKVLDLYARTWEGEPLSENESSSPPTRNPPSRPAAAATPACPRAAHR